jgi:DNA-binding transcriptional MocR family regulator
MTFVSEHYIPPSASSATDVVEAIELAIADRRLAAGDRLAPIRTAAAALELAPTTVAAAYRALAHRGLVVGRGRAGSFVAPGHAMAPPHEPVPTGLVDLASGNPDPSLLPELGPHLRRIDMTPSLYGAPPIDPALDEPARRLVADALGSEVTGPLGVVNGALDGVERVLTARLRAGDAVAVEAPGWPAVADLLTTIGLRPVAVEIDDRGMLPEGLEQVADSVDAVVVTPRMQNPTGAAFDPDRAGELRAVLRPRPRVLVVEDDHGGLLAGTRLHRISESRERWAYVHSVSKSLGPDLRLALLTGDDLTVDRVLARHSAGPGWVSHLTQRLVASLLTTPSTNELLAHARETYARRRRWMITALDDQGLDVVRGRTGLSVWANVADEHAAVAAAASAGFAIRPGGRWRMDTTPPAVRISIGMLAEPMAAAVAASIADGLRRRTTRTG